MSVIKARQTMEEFEGEARALINPEGAEKLTLETAFEEPADITTEKYRLIQNIYGKAKIGKSTYCGSIVNNVPEEFRILKNHRSYIDYKWQPVIERCHQEGMIVPGRPVYIIETEYEKIPSFFRSKVVKHNFRIFRPWIRDANKQINFNKTYIRLLSRLILIYDTYVNDPNRNGSVALDSISDISKIIINGTWLQKIIQWHYEANPGKTFKGPGQFQYNLRNQMDRIILTLPKQSGLNVIYNSRAKDEYDRLSDDYSPKTGGIVPHQYQETEYFSDCLLRFEKFAKKSKVFPSAYEKSTKYENIVRFDRRIYYPTVRGYMNNYEDFFRTMLEDYGIDTSNLKRMKISHLRSSNTVPSLNSNVKSTAAPIKIKKQQVVPADLDLQQAELQVAKMENLIVKNLDPEFKKEVKKAAKKAAKKASKSRKNKIGVN